MRRKTNKKSQKLFPKLSLGRNGDKSTKFIQYLKSVVSTGSVIGRKKERKKHTVDYRYLKFLGTL